MTIRLNDGREYEASWCIASGDTLGICINGGHNLLSVAAAFGEPDNTERITRVDGAAETEYDGYTHLTSINEAAWNADDIQLILVRRGV